MGAPKRRRILRVLIVTAAVLVAIGVALPLWFPWVLRPAGKSAGLNYTRYERDGYSRFRLYNVAFTNESISFAAERLGAFVPTAWLWNVVWHRTNQPFARIETWRFQALKRSQVETNPSSVSVYTNVANLQNIFEQLNRWLPSAVLTNGRVQINERMALALPEITWAGGRLHTSAQLPGRPPMESAAVSVSDQVIGLSTVVSNLGLRTELRATNVANGMRITGTVFWRENRFDVDALFPPEGTLPRNAEIVAQEFVLPGDAVRLEQYRDVRGSMRVVWKAEGLQTNAPDDAQFEIDLVGQATPVSGEQAPPLDIDVRATGTTNSLQLDSMKIRLPWLTAEFTERTVIQFTAPFLTAPADFRLTADLSKQTNFLATGIVQGQARLFPSTNRFPRVEFQLSGNDVAASNLQMRALRIGGEFEYPYLRLGNHRPLSAAVPPPSPSLPGEAGGAEAAAAGAGSAAPQSSTLPAGALITLMDGSQARLSTVANLETKAVETGQLEVSGAFGRTLLPSGFNFESVNLEAKFKGPFTNLQHTGRLKLKHLEVPQLKPTQIDADWSGGGSSIENATVTATSGKASLRLAAAIQSAAGAQKIELRELILNTSRQGELALREPATLWITNAAPEPATNVTRLQSLELSPLRLAGGDRALELSASLRWPESGRLHVSATNLNNALAEDFLKPTNFNFALRNLDWTGGWTNGAVEFNSTLHAAFQPGSAPEFVFQSDIRGGENGIAIRQFSVSTATQILGRATGELPVSFKPANLKPRNGVTNHWIEFDPDGAINLHAFTETNSALWNQLTTQLPLKLVNPDLHIDVTGTWAKPQGVVRAEVERLELQLKKPLPGVSNLKFDLMMDRELAVANLKAAVQEQPLRAEARLPLGEGFWDALLRDRRLPDWSESTALVELRNAKLASFVSVAPEILIPQGEFTLVLKLDRGNQLSGEALLYNAGTRPLPSIGPVRGIDARLVLSGRDLVLTNFSAQIGGERVQANGWANADEAALRAGRLPDFHLHLHGTNVPLVRQASVLVRSDLDLAITNRAASNAIVSGKVRLRDSFFLSSLGDLAPGKLASPKRRPPYFSIEKEPLAGWALSVDVEGDQFLKVQSPFFRGTASTVMRVEGNLKEPRALGEVRINSGTITFPFGSLDVRQGFVSLTSANPYEPQLFVTAEAQRMGYDIKMEATGPADSPVVQFSSSPPLSSEAIVLMLTTGQTPQGIATSATTRQRAQGMALFVGKNILSDLGIGGGGEGRLTIRSGEQMTETGRPTYDVEYRLTDEWSVVGEYDRFSQYNLGAKWKVYSK